ncbi:MAG: signal peptidase II [Fusobacteria bacterium]|nr:signal peptidase II [Fusobacteriota bacterium]
MYKYIILILILFFTDIISKIFIERLKKRDRIVIIPKMLEIRYIRNKGAAYGIFQNNLIFLNILNTIFIFLLIYIFCITNDHDKLLALCFILGGGLGNHYSRLFKKYVVDYIYIPIKHSPVFNFADIFIVTGIIMYIL